MHSFRSPTSQLKSPRIQKPEQLQQQYFRCIITSVLINTIPLKKEQFKVRRAGLGAFCIEVL